MSSGTNSINITTEYLNLNGIYYPSIQGRYLIYAEVMDNDSVSLEIADTYIDILPTEVNYFNVSWAHRDAGEMNIF